MGNGKQITSCEISMYLDRLFVECRRAHRIADEASTGYLGSHSLTLRTVPMVPSASWRAASKLMGGRATPHESAQAFLPDALFRTACLSVMCSVGRMKLVKQS